MFFAFLGPGASGNVNTKEMYFNGDLGVLYLTNARKAGFDGMLISCLFTLCF